MAGMRRPGMGAWRKMQVPCSVLRLIDAHVPCMHAVRCQPVRLRHATPFLAAALERAAGFCPHSLRKQRRRWLLYYSRHMPPGHASSMLGGAGRYGRWARPAAGRCRHRRQARRARRQRRTTTTATTTIRTQLQQQHELPRLDPMEYAHMTPGSGTMLARQRAECRVMAGTGTAHRTS